ncbi:hypothetical protein, partial [Rhizobium ruizarguesonis]|uniref:hypothetical protein n=1 Tax=Rhizobium ruizarguesonis TaxID=2081791 RepID=UPI0019537BD8
SAFSDSVSACSAMGRRRFVIKEVNHDSQKIGIPRATGSAPVTFGVSGADLVAVPTQSACLTQKGRRAQKIESVQARAATIEARGAT